MHNNGNVPRKTEREYIYLSGLDLVGSRPQNLSWGAFQERTHVGSPNTMPKELGWVSFHQSQTRQSTTTLPPRRSQSAFVVVMHCGFSLVQEHVRRQHSTSWVSFAPAVGTPSTMATRRAMQISLFKGTSKITRGGLLRFSRVSVTVGYHNIPRTARANRNCLRQNALRTRCEP